MTTLLVEPQSQLALPFLETKLRDADIADLKYIDSLRKKESAALGFIPIQQYEAVVNRWAPRASLYVLEDNGDLTGFCYVSYADNEAKIFQICVQQDARRWHRALMLADKVEAEARRCQNMGIKCRVAIDLESNYFWTAIGYKAVKKVTSTFLNHKVSDSKRELWIYTKHFNALFTNLLED